MHRRNPSLFMSKEGEIKEISCSSSSSSSQYFRNRRRRCRGISRLRILSSRYLFAPTAPLVALMISLSSVQAMMTSSISVRCLRSILPGRRISSTSILSSLSLRNGPTPDRAFGSLTFVPRSACTANVVRSLRVSSNYHPTRYMSRKVSIQTRLYSASSSSPNIEHTIIDEIKFDPTNEEETIFALSSGGGGTAGGATAVSVIRLTGPRSHDVLREMLAKPGQSLEDVKMPKARVASLRTLWDPTTSLNTGGSGGGVQNGPDQLDSALVLTFNGPRSFTGEDVVEIHCHGSRAVVRGILDTLSSTYMSKRYGLHPADRGEFTQRAYGRGKLGLTEVEALADLITADTSLQRKQALRQFDGRLSRLYEGWRSELTSCLAHAEAVIDFGDDEDLDADDDDETDLDDGGLGVWGNVVPKVDDLIVRMERHMSDSMRGEITRDGVKVAIVGPPNAGKSSFLNVLSNRDAAIVSPVAGTTRDVVEVTLDLGGVRCTVSDTAGVREEGTTDDIIEVEGIKRARRAAADAHVIVCMVDATDIDAGMSAVRELLDDASADEDDINGNDDNGCNILFVLNKVDLMGAAVEAAGEITAQDEKSYDIGKEPYRISCETSTGIEALINSLTQAVVARVVSTSDDKSSSLADGSMVEEEGAVITRARHRRHVQEAVQALRRFSSLSGQGHMALDMAAEELRLAATELGRVTGAIDVEDVLDVLFADFCIGK